MSWKCRVKYRVNAGCSQWKFWEKTCKIWEIQISRKNEKKKNANGFCRSRFRQRLGFCLLGIG